MRSVFGVHEWDAQRPPLGRRIRTDGKESWLVPHLLGVWLANEQGGPRLDDLLGNAQLMTTPLWSADGAHCASSTGVNIVNTGSETWHLIYRLITSSYYTILRNSTTGGGLDGLGIESDLLRFYASLSNPSGTRACYRYLDSAGNSVLGVPCTRTIVYDATAQTLNVYAEAILKNGSLTGTIPSVQAQTATLRTANSSGVDYISMVRLSKALNAAEVQELYRRPYCMVEPSSLGRVWYISPSIGWPPPRILQARVAPNPTLIY